MGAPPPLKTLISAQRRLADKSVAQLLAQCGVVMRAEGDDHTMKIIKATTTNTFFANDSSLIATNQCPSVYRSRLATSSSLISARFAKLRRTVNCPPVWGTPIIIPCCRSSLIAAEKTCFSSVSPKHINVVRSTDASVSPPTRRLKETSSKRMLRRIRRMARSAFPTTANSRTADSGLVRSSDINSDALMIAERHSRTSSLRPTGALHDGPFFTTSHPRT